MSKSQKKPIKATIVFSVLAVAILLSAAIACSRNDGDVAVTHDAGQESETSVLRVPDLRGSTREVLVQQFSDLGLIPSFVSIYSDAPAGTVLFIERVRQSVAAHDCGGTCFGWTAGIGSCTA